MTAVQNLDYGLQRAGRYRCKCEDEQIWIIVIDGESAAAVYVTPCSPENVPEEILLKSEKKGSSLVGVTYLWPWIHHQ